MRAIIVDIDNTLSAGHWREGMLPDWNAFHAAAKDDEPIKVMVDFITTLPLFKRELYSLVGCTGRPERFRSMTMRWLMKHEVYFEELLMRPNEDFSPSPKCKVKLVTERFPDTRNQVALVIDDRDDILAEFAAMGISTLKPLMIQVKQ